MIQTGLRLRTEEVNLKVSQMVFSAAAAVVAILMVLQAVEGFRSPDAPAAAPVVMTPAAAGAGAGAVDLPIKDFAFPAGAVTVPVGTKAVWRNLDANKHTVTADGAAFDSPKLTKDATFDHTFTVAGTFTYACAIHPTMKGTVTVAP